MASVTDGHDDEHEDFPGIVATREPNDATLEESAQPADAQSAGHCRGQHADDRVGGGQRRGTADSMGGRPPGRLARGVDRRQSRAGVHQRNDDGAVLCSMGGCLIVVMRCSDRVVAVPV
ncbi:unnamed protein product [Angiostrongylus costaricensis]|uniref:Protein of unassigned function n=1 Tax=Angiostrongylus costaricensis TaxID=334426 RepID=A0A0R3PC24_ANGCS|nr:unnamed protein product [Angiostrongylus costaricensis]